MSLQSDQMIAHYRLVEKIGEGGMGVVWKVRDTKLKRHVALKFIAEAMSLNETFRIRFIREARAASALEHSNICTIYEIDETDDGRLYIAMPYYKGKPLNEMVRHGPLPVDQALDITRQIAAGLQAAHEAKIVHRDMKSANVFVTDNGVVKILDFGLAKMTVPQTTDSSISTAADANLTRTGTTMGTVAYMSPEQARGQKLDARTDIFSLGVLMYEMFTGSRPFRAKTDFSTVDQILNKTPEPLRSVRSNLPDALEGVISRALEKEMSKRYQSVAKLLENLQVIRVRERAPVGWPAFDPAATTIVADSSREGKPRTRRKVVKRVYRRNSQSPQASWIRQLLMWIPAVAVVILGAVAIYLVMNFPRVQPGSQAGLSEEEPVAALPVPQNAASETLPMQPSDSVKTPSEKEVLDVSLNTVDSEDSIPAVRTEDVEGSPPSQADPGDEGTGTLPMNSTPQEVLQPGRLLLNASPEGAEILIAGIRPSGYVVGEFRPGARPYIDRQYVYSDIPDALIGLHSLQTANADKASNVSVSFRVVRPLTVYIAHDKRIKKKPVWLDSYEPTGGIISVTQLGKNRKIIQFEIYRRVFEPGDIALGPNIDLSTNRRGSKRSMYLVFFE